MIDRKFLFASLVASMAMLPAVNADAAMSKDQVSAHVAKEFGVQVLDVSADRVDGKAVFIVKIMFLGGNFNTAFQVNTWVVDADNGKRIPQFQHLSSGQKRAGGHEVHANRQRANALRGHIWR